MTLRSNNNNISWYPLIWIAVFMLSPFLIIYFDDSSILEVIAIPLSISGFLLQYLEMKYKTLSIEGDSLKINKLFSKKDVVISQLKYAKILDNTTVKRFLFGSGTQSIEIYGKWGFEVLDVEQPEVLLEELKSKSEHFN